MRINNTAYRVLLQKCRRNIRQHAEAYGKNLLVEPDNQQKDQCKEADDWITGHPE